MSTKTTTKRVALATVVALGAGVLSLVTVSSASATPPTPTITTLDSTVVNSAAGSANSLSVATGRLFQATAASATGAATTSTDPSQSTSVGLVNTSDIAGGYTAGTTQTAVLLNTGTLVVYETASTVNYDEIQVVGGTIVNTANGAALNSAATLASAALNSSASFSAAIKPNSGVTSMQISLYAGASASGNTSGGTLSGYINVTVASSSVAGTASLAKSGVWYTDNSTSGLTADKTGTSYPNNPFAGTAPYGVTQYADIRELDAYGSPIPATASHLTTATATNGALISLGTGTSSPTQTTAFLAGNMATDNTILSVAAPSSAPLTTVVTVSLDGVVIGTKSFTFTGQVAKIILSAPSNGALSSTGTATIAFADAAGNAVYPSNSATTGSGNAKYPLTSLLNDGATFNSYITGGSVTLAPVSGTAGVYTFTTGASAGSATIDVKYTNLDGSVITSNALKVNASDNPYAYTASLDKSTYNVGDIATLTVKFTDSKGNVANDNGGIASATSGMTPSISGGLLGNSNGSTTTNGNATDATTNGVATYKFVVGQPTDTPYSGQLLVSFPLVNARNSAQTTQLVAYTIGGSSTSLNDVLKGIVSLIASINKQIAALAKLVAPAKKK